MSRPTLADLAPDPEGNPPFLVDPAFLDELDWPYQSTGHRLLDLHLRVRCVDAVLGQFIAAFLSAYPTSSVEGSKLDVTRMGDRWIAYLDGRRSVAGDSREGMARTLVWDLNVSALAAPSTHLHIHAAVAVLGGKAIVIAGRSGAGKSTLVTALAMAGWDYFTDEVADIDPDGIVHAYPRPIALDPGSLPFFPDVADRWPAEVPRLITDLDLVLPSSLTPPAATTAAIAALVLPEVRPGEPTSLETVQRAEVLETLIPLTFNLRDLGVPGFDRLASLVTAMPCYQLILDGIADAPRVLRHLIG